MKGVWILLLVLLLLGCSEPKEFYVGEYQPQTVTEKDVPTRPIINKTPYIEPEPVEPEEPDIPRKPVPELSTPVEEYRLSVGYGLLALNDTIGQRVPAFTKYEFPELLKSRNVRSHIDPIAASYEQFLKLLGGRVIFTANEQDEVMDYLVYRDGEPIYRYEWVLSQGSFLDFIDEEIWFLGHKYAIVDTTKEDVTLEGVDLPVTLVIGDGNIYLNGETLEDTESIMTGDRMVIIAKADATTEGDDIFIPYNSSLQEFLGEPTILTDRLDVRYKGIAPVPHTRYIFNNRDEELELIVEEPGRTSIVPLAFIEGRLGDEEGMLHVREAASRDDFKVKENDYFILSPSMSASQIYYRHRQDNNGSISIALQYKGSDKEKAEFVSREGVALEAYYNNKTGEGIIPFAGREFKFYVGEGLAVDMNGDGRVSGSLVDYRTGDAIIDLPSSETFDGPFNISIRLLNYDNGMKEEKKTLTIIPDGEFLIGFEGEVYDYGDDGLAVSDFGTRYILENEEGDGYEELIIEHPLARALAEIVVESNR